MLRPQDRIFVAGHRGLVGAALVRKLQGEGYGNLLTAPRAQLDLTRQEAVERYFESTRPDVVLLAAARVGGILANSSFPAEFLRDNLLIESNVIDAAYRSGVRQLLYLGSSCIYPRLAPQPMAEESLLTGPLEPTNEWYAIAKIAGLKLCQAYHQQYGFQAISLMPTNLYGPGDNFHPDHSHVIPGLLRRFHEAQVQRAPEVVVWGTGNALREFMYVDDLAGACLFLLNHYAEPDIINVGSGAEVSIRELVGLVKQVTGYAGQVRFDAEKPDGTPRKRLDSSRLARLGWSAKKSLADGLAATYAWYLEHASEF